MIQNLTKPGKLKFVVVDDHEFMLDGTINALRQQYPEEEIIRATTAQSTLNQVAKLQPDLVVVDLSLPETLGKTATIKTGIQVLKTLITNYPNLNLVVLSCYTEALVHIKPEIEAHQGGFLVVDKNLSSKEMLDSVYLALRKEHRIPLKIIRTEKVNSKWIDLLNCAFQEGLTDRAIAQRLNVAERTVRKYWQEIQKFLDIDPKQCRAQGKNLRITTKIEATKKGLLG